MESENQTLLTPNPSPPEQKPITIKLNLKRAREYENAKKKHIRPRWYNQMNVVHMALKQFPNYTATRGDLLKAAVELDKKISNEKGYHRVFTGKTPLNSASACLTNNHDSYFISFKDDTCKHFQFKLSYTPGCFHSAYKSYLQWMNFLINLDWPKCFGKPLKELNFDDTVTKKEDKKVYGPYQPLEKNGFIPNCLEDLIEVKDSTIENAGKGLFSKIYIPKSTPIGFYFGVPMTEDEYDSLKDHIGLASSYSIMYRKTVLDATNKDGMPFQYGEEGYCPFHFMNEHHTKGNVSFIEGSQVNQVICVAYKNVEPGDELFVHYGDEVDRQKWQTKN